MSLDIISRHRAPIYGFSILWIVVFHGVAINGVDYTFGHDALEPLAAFIKAGNVGVDMFLFLSGVCLYFSFVRNPDIVAFLKRRLVRIVPAAWIVYGGYWAYTFFVKSFSPADFLSRITLLRF